jgi:hypothetical protein
MMSQIDRYSFSDRQRAKAASRAQDESDLEHGHVSRVELAAANGVFSALDLSRAAIRRRSPIGR